jgi:hypothetical protein
MFGFAAVLSACGGGGGGGGTDAAGLAAAPGTSAAASGMSPDIAAWGDSMTATMAPNLQLLYGDRSVLNEGHVGWTSTQIAGAELADTAHRNWISIFWYGQNNDTEPERIKADVAASIAHLAPGNTRFVVLGVVNRADGTESRGTTRYDTIVRLNADLAAAYPANFIDIRAFLVSRYDANNAQDVADFNADVPPSSLRNDEIHLRNEGSLLVAQRVKQFIDAKGW